MIRESASDDFLLMDGMIQQTLNKTLHLPGAEELLAGGIDVVTNPERFRGTHARDGRSRFVFVERGGVLYFYCMGSAAKSGANQDNAFVRQLVELINTYRPRELWAAAFTRFVRAAEHAGALLAATKAHVEVIHAESDIEPSTTEGQMAFQMLTLVAAAERDYIVKRHTTGRVVQWRRGHWISIACPPGYRLADKAKKDRTLVLDTDQIESVRAGLRLLADPSLTAREWLMRAGAAGLSTDKVRQIHGAGAKVDGARSAKSAQDTLLGWLPLYRTGQWSQLWRNPFPGAKVFAGLPVLPSDNVEDYPHGVLEMKYQLPIPPGGWASDEVFDAIEKRPLRLSPTGGAAHAKTSPLAGLFRSRDDEHEYALLAEPTVYIVRRRPYVEDRVMHGWHAVSGDDSEALLLVDREGFHAHLADTIIQAVEEGLPAELDVTRVAPTELVAVDNPSARLRELQRRLAEEEQLLEQATQVLRSGNTDVEEWILPTVKTATAKRRQLLRDISDLENAPRPSLTPTFTSNVALVAHALAGLKAVSGSAPLELNVALRSVIARSELRVDDGVLHWAVYVELPHENGTVVLGPIEGSMRGRLPRFKREGAVAYREKVKLLMRLEAAGLTRAAARSAAACPRPELAAALLGHSDAELDEAARLTPDWETWVRSVYLKPDFKWNPGRWVQSADARQRLLDALAVLGGEASESTLLEREFQRHDLRNLSRRYPTSLMPSVWVDRTGSERIFRLHRCPHCSTLVDTAVLTPETPSWLLCRGCLRMPLASSPLFPAWYLEAVGRAENLSERS